MNRFDCLYRTFQLISDAYQKRGIETKLLEQLIQIGHDEGLDYITAEILPENRAMQRVCEKVGFRLKRMPDFIEAKIDVTMMPSPPDTISSH